MPETAVAHCGGCIREMALDVERPADAAAGHAPRYRYVCGGCGFTTPWRTDAQAAGEDVVWATLTQSWAARDPRRAHGADNRRRGPQ